MDTIYILVGRNDGRVMGRRFAADLTGIEAVVREHYRECFYDDAIDIDLDLESYIVTVSRQRYTRTYLILPIQDTT